MVSYLKHKLKDVCKRYFKVARHDSKFDSFYKIVKCIPRNTILRNCRVVFFFLLNLYLPSTFPSKILEEKFYKYANMFLYIAVLNIKIYEVSLFSYILMFNMSCFFRKIFFFNIEKKKYVVLICFNITVRYKNSWQEKRCIYMYIYKYVFFSQSLLPVMFTAKFVNSV